MHRYVGFLWDARDTLAAGFANEIAQLFVASHAGWEACCRTPSMLVYIPHSFDAREHIRPLPRSLGVILGRLFPVKAEHWRDGWHVDLQDAVATSFATSGGATLVDHFWGSYIAFLSDPGSNINYVVRDCSGAIPCYSTSHRKVSIVFSDINDLAGLGLPPFELDPEYLSAFIYWPELQVNRCAARGITEVLAGQRLQQKHGVPHVSSLWNPCEVVRSGSIDSVTAARSALRSTTEYCIAAWASTYATVVLSLSGGLDSAIVLGCLSRIAKRPHVICANRYSRLPGEDERSYARGAAELGGVELIELPWCSTKRAFDGSLLAFPKTPKPFVPLPFVLLDAGSWNEVTNRYQAQAVWTGQGGDHIFFNVPTSLGAADYIQTHRWILSPRRTLTAIVDAARYSREPYIAVWRNSRKLARSRAPWKSDIQAARTGKTRVSFLAYETLPANIDEYVMHPWLSHRDDLPKGKQLQIELMLELLNRDRFSSVLYGRPERHPLVSQPLLELSLRIPIQILTVGGRQRGLARQAFKDVVPTEILAREDKGGTSSFWMQKIRDSQPFLRDLLLGGWLAKEGIVDRTSLEPHLCAGHPIRPAQWSPLAACIAAEMWARSWISERAPTTRSPALEAVVPPSP
jgi:asparagine synthase (glutamine-hydrolysing)